MKKIIFVAAILSLFLNACKNEPKKIENLDQAMDKFSKAPGLNKSERNYDVDLPKGWTFKDTVIKGVKFHFLFPPQEVAGSTGANVNILNESMNDVTFDKYMEKTEQTMKDYMPQYKKLGTGSFNTVDHIKGEWFYYSARQSNANLECIAYIIPSNGIAYIITAGTRKGHIAEFRGAFDSIAQSFRFKE